jgi:Ca2+/Na+ antiporter
MLRLRRFWPFIFIAVCAILPLWRALLMGETIGPFDQVRHMAPWNGPAPTRPYDVLQADAVLQFYPWRDMVFESWGHGQVPAWNPYELAGTPLLANSQSAGFYPPHVVAGLLHIPTGFAISLLAWFHLLWAGLGAYFLTRRLGGSRIGATVAGTAFCLSPFMLAWTGLSSVITTASWIPWVLGFVVALFQHAESVRVRNKRVVCLALCTAMMLLAGHLQFSAYGLGAAVFMAVWLLVSTRKSREPSDNEYRAPAKQKHAYLHGWALLRIVLGLGFGAMLAAPQLLPVLQYGKFSHRANVPAEQGYNAYVAGAIPWSALQGIAFPTALGDPSKPTPIKARKLNGANEYWPALTNRGMDFAETALGVGPLVFILLFFRRKLAGPVLPLLVSGIIALLIALGTGLNRPFYFLVPGWSAGGSPGRAIVLFALALCVVAGTAVDYVPLIPKKTVQLGTILAVLGALVLALLPVLFSINYPTLFSRDAIMAAIKATVANEAPIFLVTGILALAALLAFREKPAYKIALPVVTALCALIGYGFNLIPTGDASSLAAGLPKATTARMAFANPFWGLFTASRDVMPPNTAVYGRLHDLAGYDSLMHRDSVALLHSIDGEDAAASTNGNMMLVKPKADPKALADAGVTEIWSLRPLSQFYASPKVENGIFKYPNPGPGRAFTPAGPATITAEDYGHIEVEATGPGPLTLKDRMMPGWAAEVDGAPAAITGEPWRIVQLAEGKHKIIFRYQPPGMITGFLLACVAGLLCMLLWLPAFIKR